MKNAKSHLKPTIRTDANLHVRPIKCSLETYMSRPQTSMIRWCVLGWAAFPHAIAFSNHALVEKKKKKKNEIWVHSFWREWNFYDITVTWQSVFYFSERFYLGNLGLVSVPYVASSDWERTRFHLYTPPPRSPSVRVYKRLFTILHIYLAC